MLRLVKRAPTRLFVCGRPSTAAIDLLPRSSQRTSLAQCSLSPTSCRLFSANKEEEGYTNMAASANSSPTGRNTLPKPIVPFVPDFVLKMLGYYSVESTMARRAENLFRSAEHQSRKASFYVSGKVSKDFKSKHVLLALHVWMIHKRLIRKESALDIEYNKQLQEQLFDTFWSDTGSRIRNVGIRELMYNKYLKDVQNYTFESLAQFDNAVTMPTYKERHDELSSALWRVIYGGSDSISDDHVRRFARYVERETEKIKGLEEVAFLDGRIEWGRAPRWDPKEDGVRAKTRRGRFVQSANAHSEEILPVDDFQPGDVDGGGDGDGEAENEDDRDRDNEDGKEEGEDDALIDQVEGGLPKNWRTALTDGGQQYYYNTVTRESSWEKPV